MKEKLTNLEPSAVAPRTACRHTRRGGARPGCSCSSCPRLGNSPSPKSQKPNCRTATSCSRPHRYVFRNVASTCHSWTSHVGIAFRGVSGWEVAESTVPISRFTSLRWFIRKSESRRFTLCRLKTGLSMNLKVGRYVPEMRAVNRVRTSGGQRTARPTSPIWFGGSIRELGRLTKSVPGPSFSPAPRRRSPDGHRLPFRLRLPLAAPILLEICARRLRRGVGRPARPATETFTDLLTGNPDAPLAFWQYWFFGRIPWDRVTVTPATQLQSELLDTINSGGGDLASKLNLFLH